MGVSESGISEENHIVSRSWIAWLTDDSIGTILSVYHFVRTILSVPFCPIPFCYRTFTGYAMLFDAMSCHAILIYDMSCYSMPY